MVALSGVSEHPTNAAFGGTLNWGAGFSGGWQAYDIWQSGPVSQQISQPLPVVIVL